MGGDRRFAGRDSELRVLGDALRSAAGGVPRAVIVHGEAGIGKTRLVREAVGDLRLTVLWGACVHFGGASVPYAPIIGLLHNWHTRAGPGERADVLHGIDGLGALLPSFGSRAADARRLPVLVDLVLDRIAARGPAVAVIDDLQWADVASLDVLSYLIAGFRDRQLTLIATCRTEERPEGHPLHSWLADMRRMPLFSEILLEPLGLEAVGAQLTGLLGTPPDIELVSEVLARSDGNPYLVELMAGGLSGSEHSLGSTVPAALRDALLATWHGLSDAARMVSRILAVGGRPTGAAVLVEVAAGHGLDAGAVASSLLEAQDRGVVRSEGADAWWFRHPLLAEVLYDGLPHDQAVALHTGYILALESHPAQASPADLAAHHEAAGDLDATFRWSIQAADEARRLRAPTEEAIQLRRACALWLEVTPQLHGTREQRIALLRRASTVCQRASEPDVGVGLLTEALSLVDRKQEPLLACDLMVARADYTWQSAAPGTADLAELQEAIALTDAFGDSAERAIAFAQLASIETLYGMPSAEAHAAEAVRTARRSKSDRALARALGARAAVMTYTAPEQALTAANLSEQLAKSCGEVDAATDAAIFRALTLRGLGRHVEAVSVTRAAYLDAVAAGAGVWAQFLAYLVAETQLDLGDWAGCRELLRSALAARPSGIPGAAIRLAACLLAVRSGRTTEARQHFDRALELVSADFNPHRPVMTIAGVELLLAEGRAAEAVAWAVPRLYVPEYPEPDDDEVLPVLARAVADVARYSGAQGLEASREIDSVLAGWPHEPYVRSLHGDQVRARNQAMLAAEVSRCRNSPDQAQRWSAAAATSRAAGNPWHAAWALWRCAEAGLIAGWPPSRASAHLREAHRCALELGAEPLRREIESLGRRTKIDLSPPVPVEPVGDPRLAGLTKREREVLAFLVAGRTNTEIAQELCISDKTVSVHVSNILRKTGTTNRLSAAALADHHRRPARHSACTTPPPVFGASPSAELGSR